MGIVMTPAGLVYVPGSQMQRPPFEIYDLPTISGSLREGQTVTAQSGTFSGNPTQVSYTFLLMSGGIAVDSVLSANGNYVIPAGSAGYELRVRQFAQDAVGQRIRNHPTGVESVPYVVLAAGAPVFTGNPTLSAQRAETETVTCSPGTFTGTPTPTPSFQWWLDGLPVDGQTLNTWRIPTGSQGKPFHCVVTIRNTHGSVSLATETAEVTNAIVFPPNIDPTLWTVSEIRDSTEAAGVTGKRKLVLGAITVPTGFELRWASQADPQPIVKSTLPAVSPNGTFVNEFPLPVGTQNGNVLFWRHVPSDPTVASNLNAWKEATEIRVITIQGIGTTSPTPSDPPPADTMAAPSTAAISAASSTPLRRHDESSNGTPGWAGAMGMDFLALCLASRAGKTSVDTRIANYLANVFSPGAGRDPTCTGHYIAQMDLRTLSGCTVLKHTPRYWDSGGLLSTAMKRRITKSIDASLFSSAWNVMDNQPAGSGSGNRTMRGVLASTKSTGSNIALGPLGLIVNAVCFYGSGTAAQSKMANYDHIVFRDSLIADGDGLQNAYDSFNSRNRSLTDQADGTLANVPTNSEMNAAMRGAWTYYSTPITGLYGLLQLNGSQGLNKALSKKIMWGKRDGVGCYLEGTTTPSGWGFMIGTSTQRSNLPGLNTAASDFFEWDSSDGGDRSSGQYVSYTMANVLAIVTAIRVSGLHDPGNADWMSILRRIDRAMASYNYKADHGYRSWAHNSSGGIHAGLWGRSQTETNPGVTSGWGGDVDSYKAWGCEYARSIWSDVLRPALL